MRSCIQLFGWGSFCSFARCGGLKGETFINLYVYNSIYTTTSNIFTYY
jgi:hypothetical protein